MALAVGLLAGSLFGVTPGGAQSVDEKIKTLETELSQLKEQQIELKREATEAAAALPTFSYRPGNGMLIEAADKSWSFRHSFEAHFNYQFLSGRDQAGRSQGELQGRPARLLYASDADHAQVGQRVQAEFAVHGVFDEDVCFMRKDSSPVWARVQGRAVQPDGGAQGGSTVCR